MKPAHALAAAGVFVVSLVTYIITLSPTVGLVDSGALTIAAWGVGNAHPPGFPLYLLTTKLVTLLPVGTIAYRANLASALFAALACLMASLVVREALLSLALRPRVAPKPRKKRASPQDAEPQPENDLVIAIAMTIGGLLLTFGRTLWSYATVAEVYALNTFLIATVILLMLRWRRKDDIRWLYAASVVFGLALGVHHVTVALTLVAIAVFVVRTAGLKFFGSRQLGIAALGSTAALLLVYSYLPVAAARDPLLNWGDPSTVQRFLDHVTAKQYRSYIKPASSDSQFADLTRLTAREAGPRVVPIALLVTILGLLQALRKDRSLFWLLALVIAGAVAWFVVYPIDNDEDAYLLPVFLALAIAGGFFVGATVRRTAVAALFLCLPVIAAAAHWQTRDRSDFHVSKDYVDNTLRAMAPDSLLITNDWQLWAPAFYFLNAENVRPDVVAIEYGMLIRTWYLEQIARQHPDLIGRVSNAFEAFSASARISETDPHRAAEAAVERIYNRRLDDLVLAMIAAKISSGGHAYVTGDIAHSREAADVNLVGRLATQYDMIPAGTALKLVPHGSAPAGPLPPLSLRGLLDRKWAEDDVVATEIIPTYRNISLVRARYFRRIGNPEAARVEYETALRLAPGDAAITSEMAIVNRDAARGAGR